MEPGARREQGEARAPAEGGAQRVRGRLTVRGVLEILAEQASEETVCVDSATPADEDLRAVLAFVEGDGASGVVR